MRVSNLIITQRYTDVGKPCEMQYDGRSTPHSDMLSNEMTHLAVVDSDFLLWAHFASSTNTVHGLIETLMATVRFFAVPKSVPSRAGIVRLCALEDTGVHIRLAEASLGRNRSSVHVGVLADVKGSEDSCSLALKPSIFNQAVDESRDTGSWCTSKGLLLWVRRDDSLSVGWQVNGNLWRRHIDGHACEIIGMYPAEELHLFARFVDVLDSQRSSTGSTEPNTVIGAFGIDGLLHTHAGNEGIHTGHEALESIADGI